MNLVQWVVTEESDGEWVVTRGELMNLVQWVVISDEFSQRRVDEFSPVGGDQ